MTEFVGDIRKNGLVEKVRNGLNMTRTRTVKTRQDNTDERYGNNNI